MSAVSDNTPSVAAFPPGLDESRHPAPIAELLTADAAQVLPLAVSGGRRVQDTDRVHENVRLLKYRFGDGRICQITECSNPVAFAKFFGRPVS